MPFDQNDEVPLGYRTTIDQVDGLLANQAVFIEDKLTNTLFDLKTGNYNFSTTAGVFNNRFVMRYSNNKINKTLTTNDVEIAKNEVLISNTNKEIKINSFAEIIDSVAVYDILGRQLYQKIKIDTNEFSIANLISTNQMLLVKIELQNGMTVTDKIIF